MRAAHDLWLSLRDGTNRLVSRLSREQTALTIVIAVGVLYIVSNARFGLADPMAWRQADVYAHILGFAGSKSDVPALTTFQGYRSMFDVPIYELAIGVASRLTRVDPLIVTRFANAAIWVGFVLAVHRLGEQLVRGSGIIVAACMSVSPLVLHYWSVPLPDILAITLAIAGITTALDRRFTLAAAAFGFAALIKSPIPLVMLVWLGVYAIATGRLRTERAGYLRIAAVALVGALSAEGIRYLVTPPTASTDDAFATSWYFGSLSQRRSLHFWADAVRRLDEGLPGTPLVLAAVVVVAIALVVRWRAVWPAVAASCVAYLAGWMTFATLYSYHNYYSMPGVILLLVAVGVATKALLGATPRVPFAVALVVPLLAVYGVKLSSRDVTDAFDAARYAFRDQSTFVMVEDPSLDTGPAWGGATEALMVNVSPTMFADRCEQLLASYHAFVTHGVEGTCLDDHRAEAATVIDADEFTVWVFDATDSSG